MLIIRAGVHFHYQVTGSGPQPVLLLHGWGREASYWQPLVDGLAQRSAGRYKFYAVDLPGFGLSSTPQTAWGSEEYAHFLADWMQELEPTGRWVVLGHSFGGKVALYLVRWLMQNHRQAAIRQLILLDSAGIKTTPTIRQRLRSLLAKGWRCAIELGGRWQLWRTDAALARWRQRFGSDDYNAATGLLRQILVRVVAEDVSGWLASVLLPVLLIWGQQDRATPLAQGQLMAQQLPQARLVVLPQVGHDPLINAELIIQVVSLISNQLQVISNEH